MITVERIQLKDIDLTKLKKMPIQGTRSTVYDAGDICVKIFENIDKEELDKLYRKIKARIVRRNMENIDIFLRL